MKTDLTPAQMRLVKSTIASDCNAQEFDLFMAAARSYGLDPFRKQILPLVFNKGKADRRRMSIVVSRDGLRVIAQRCGDYRPANKPAQIEYDESLKGPTNPKGIVSATVYLWKRDSSGEWYEVAGEADWDEFVPLTDEWAADETGKRRPTGKKTVDGNWQKMPKVMITKCAEAQALRAGWPDQFSGIYVQEEMDKSLSDMTATEAVEAEALREREAAVGAGRSIMVTFSDGVLDRIPIGRFFDRVMEHIKEMPPADVLSWSVQNREPLREFWAAHPNDALELKKAIEAKTNVIGKENAA